MSEFSERFNKMMTLRGYKPVELVEYSKAYWKECGDTITKANVYQWSKGMWTPSTKKMLILAKTLGVDENWLSGGLPSKNEKIITEYTAEELVLVNCWRQASYDEKETIAFILRNYGMTLEKNTSSQDAV